MWATFNLSIYKMDRYGIQKQFSFIHCVVTDGNTDGLYLSVYSRDEGNYSPPLGTIHYTVTDENINGHKPSMYSRGKGNCYVPSPCHYSRLTTPKEIPPTILMETPMDRVHRCIPKRMKLFPFSYQWLQLLSVRFPRELLMDYKFQCLVN